VYAHARAKTRSVTRPICATERGGVIAREYGFGGKYRKHKTRDIVTTPRTLFYAYPVGRRVKKTISLRASILHPITSVVNRLYDSYGFGVDARANTTVPQRILFLSYRPNRRWLSVFFFLVQSQNK
jgi:hypothetical protein